MKLITVVDYGLGNILSVQRAFEYLGCKVQLVQKGEGISFESPVIIPGVGAFPEAMNRLSVNGLTVPLGEAAKNQVPILGICLGMQLLFSRGTEHQECPGLDLLDGSVEKMKTITSVSDRQTLPSIGWKKMEVSTTPNDPPFVKEIKNRRFYFVHSFRVSNVDQKMIKAWYLRNDEKIPALIIKDKIFGAQFHPEKSGKDGLEFLQSFVEWT